MMSRLFTSRAVALVALAVGLGACTSDPPAEITPSSGLWMYTEDFVADDTCPVDLLPNATTEFVLDYDAGDSFQIELGAVDASCEIDGTRFECVDYELATNQVDGFDAFIRVGVTWSGELVSSDLIEGHELVTATCSGEDCNLVDDLVPCLRDTEFTAEFVG